MNKHKIIQILHWTILRFPSNRHLSYKKISQEWVDTIFRLYDTRGAVNAIALLKGVRLHYTRYLSGNPLKDPAETAIGLNSKGLPRMSRSLQNLVDGDLHDKRFLMTLLTLSRSLPGWKPFDTTPITDLGREIDPELVDGIAQMAPPVSITTDFEELHITTKTGPQGLALDWSLADLALLPESGIAKDIITLGGQTLRDVMNEAFALLEMTESTLTLTPQKGNSLRRLSVKKDLESKARVFAILDYWSQTAMKRLHKELSELLRSFKADCTFDQGSRLSRLSPKNQFHSLDLTNATDRFPRRLQVAILARLIGQEKAEAWERIMTKLPFDLNGSPIAYARGQPMGAYSSWPLFALSHHLTVQYAAKEVGKTDYSNYMLLGDDIVIADDDVAVKYREVLKQLDVPISTMKTHVSKDTFEFAKRWIHRGEEITGLPFHGLLSYSGPSTVLSFLETYERNWNSTSQTFSRSDIANLIRPIFPYPKDNEVRLMKVRNHQIHLAALRVWESITLPKGGVKTWTEGRNFENIWYTYQKLIPHHFGCNHMTTDRVISLLGQLIPMSKIKSGEAALKETVKGLNKYRNALIKLMAAKFGAGLSPELPQQLLTHPALRAGLAFARSAQLEIDRMENLIAECREEEILDDPPVIGFDPSKLLTIGQKDLRFLVAAQVPKVIKGLVAMRLENRRRVLNGEDSLITGNQMVSRRGD